MALGSRSLAALLAMILVSGALPARAQDFVVSRGDAPGGYAVAIEREDGEVRVLCEPACELTLPGGPLRVGWRRGAREIEWQRALTLDSDVRLDVAIEDRSVLRTVAYALLIVGAVLIGATAIAGIATEPTPPEVGWFGSNHALVFGAIAGGIVLAFGVPGVVLAVEFERDAPAIAVIPEE